MANPSIATAGTATRFAPGNAGGGRNPAKRAAGQACWEALLADFGEHGVQAIIDMRTAKPEQYVSLVASGLPAEKAIDLTVKHAESLSDEQSRLMAEEILERHKRRTASAGLTASVHDSVSTGLPTGPTSPQDR